ncbi:MAG: PAS domain S-box protein [Candidatus Lokiarchaeota archaeon]|nr:PAS domain S-box protein [Candidatus Lokiarchaeota archaeon]
MPCIIEQTLKDGKVHEIEKELYEIKGKKKILWCTSSVFERDSEGKPISVIEVCRDITTKKESQEQLKQSEKKYREMSELLPDIIYEIDRELNLTYSNSAGFAEFGYDRRDLEKGLKAIDLVADEFRELALNKIKKHLNGKIIQPSEILMTRKDGSTFYARVHSKPIIKKGRIVGFRGVISNIHKMIMAQRKLNFYKDLLAHDIANILTRINLAVDLNRMIMKKKSTNEESLLILDSIKFHIQDGINLLSNIQRLSQIEHEDFKTGKENASRILKKVVGGLIFSDQKNISININARSDDLYVNGGPFLKDIFENIIINGIKHNDSDKKWMEINVKRIKDDNKTYVQFEFADNGLGIPDDIKKKIFDREHKSNIDSKGMGIGLSLVNTIIKEYDGEIWVSDRIKGDYKKGSIFYVRLLEA